MSKKADNNIKAYFDTSYLEIYAPIITTERTATQVDFLEKALKLKPHHRILDVACGHGRHAIELAKRGYTYVTGVDFTKAYIVIAKKEAKKNDLKVRFLVEDARSLPSELEGNFDRAYMIFTSFGYFDDEENERIIKEVSKALKRKGLFLLEVVNREAMLAKLAVTLKEWTESRKGKVWCLESHKFDPITSRLYTEEIILERGKDPAKRKRFIRLYTLTELASILKSASLEVSEVYGDYNGEEYQLRSKRLILVSKRK